MMKRWQAMLAAAGICASLVVAAPGLAATFNSGSTGADGPFNPACTPTPCTVTVALPPSGIFSFTTINVPAGVTVKFTKNATNTPATMLASGDVTIAGTINLDGQAGIPAVVGTFFASAGGGGGPGGFDGGAGGNGVNTASGGVGLGPGGGSTGPSNSFCPGGGGGFGTPGAAGSTSCVVVGGAAYGNPQLLPLIGGSGGGGGSSILGNTGGSGGGGAGAILVAASGTLTFTGAILARGGAGGNESAVVGIAGGGGSGGGVRLMATTLAGSGGTITVTGGAGRSSNNGAGGIGRIRLEAYTNTLAVNVSGVTPSVGTPGVGFPPGLPSLAIISVAGLAAPAAPTGSYSTPDITLPNTTTSPVAVVVTATGIPDGTPIVLRAKPQTGAATSATTPGLSGGTASANLALDLTQPNVISAEATFQIAAADVPVKVAQAAGPEDPVTHVRVSAAFGGASQIAYVTGTGRELSP